MKEGNHYCLVSVDMDGTLLMSDKTVHPDTVRDLGEAEKRGIAAAYCSGRSVAEIMPYRDVLPMIRYGILTSGAVVYDFQEMRSIFFRPVPQQYVELLVKTAERYRGMLHFLMEEESIVGASDVTHMADFHMGVYQQTFHEVMRLVPSMAEEAKKPAGIAKLNIYFRSAEDRQKACEELRHLPLTMIYSEETSLEINAEGVTKALGLSVLCDHLGIPMEETIGIGDSENDRAFLEAAGFSVAMGNAGESIASICDAVTADNDHNGVGEALQKYCFT